VERRRLSTPRSSTGSARLAFAALLLFVVMVYASPGMLFMPDRPDSGFAKAAAAAALVSLGGAWLLGDRPLRVGGAPGLLLAGFFALVGLSASWSLWPSMTLTTFVEGLKYFAIFLLVGNVADREDRARSLLRAIAALSVVPALGTIHSFSRGEHLVDGDRAAWVGVFANPNDLAYHLDVGIALALGARELATRRLARLGWLAAIAVMSAALLLTQSRGGLMAAGTVLGLWSLRGLRRGRTLVATAAIVALAIYFAPRETWERAGTIEHYQEDASARGRIDAWRTGLRVVEGRPLTGVGAGVFALAWAEFAPGDAGPPRSAHNTLVQVGAETGVPSLALFVGAILAAVLALSKAASPSSGLASLARAVQVAIGAFAVSSLTGGLAFSWPLYLLLGLAVAIARVSSASPDGAVAALQ
jgi:O-antigen ligase